MSIEDIQLIRGVGFLKELSIFSQLEEQSLKAIWPICSCQKYERGQIVYQEGQIATYIYLIKEGEVSISRLLENDTKDSQKTQNLPERIVKKNLIWQSEIAQKKKEKVFIAKLGENQYFGELELLTSNINLRYTRATCESKTTLYSISKKQLIAILGQNGLSSQISEIFQLRTTIYDEQTQKLDIKNKEGVKINFNRLRMFSQKCQFIQEHMQKLQNKAKASQEQQSQQSQNTQVIWQEEQDNKEPDTFISNILNKTKNHHLVRLQQIWKVLKEGKPNLRQSMGLENNSMPLTQQYNHNQQDQNDLDEKQKNLLCFMKKKNILSKQFTINSQDNQSSSSYSQQFRNTSQTCDKNTQFDEVISDDFNFYEKERYNSIFQNTQSSKSQIQSRKGSSNVQLENQKYFFSYYNYGIMNQNNTNQQNSKNITQSSINHSKSQDFYLNNTNLKTSMNTSNNSNISLPWLQQKYSKPHFTIHNFNINSEKIKRVDPKALTFQKYFSAVIPEEWGGGKVDPYTYNRNDPDPTQEELVKQKEEEEQEAKNKGVKKLNEYEKHYNITRTELGNCGWMVLHMISATYPLEVSEEFVDKTNLFLNLFGQFYPCKECSGHFLNMTSKQQFTGRTRQDFMEYMCDLHNQVNKRLGKEIKDCKKYPIEKWGGNCGCQSGSGPTQEQEGK
ncbi:hypothetical protein ABPG74_016780 [Tetrahymena malaccensis]